MLRPFQQASEELTQALAEENYRPALAKKFLDQGEFARAVETCKEHLKEEPGSISARVIYASALLRAGQKSSAVEQFHQVLAIDQTNQIAVKALADIKFDEGDVVGAIADYERILEMDPHCRGVKSDLPVKHSEDVKVTLKRGAEEVSSAGVGVSRSKFPFYTETIGDLYLRQGHHRQAVEIFKTMYEQTHDDRIAAKLNQARHRLKE
jgi:tetratricopeptide (TPR) repeat protein